MEVLIDFFSFSDVNVRYVVFGSILLCAGAAIVGCFTFLRKRALIGDAVAHSVLPGVALAFIMFETKNPLILIIGAAITGWISILAIDVITQKSKIKADTAIGLVLSVFFGIGILLLTSIQQSGSAAQSGLDKFLFGKAASLVGGDLITFAVVSTLLILTVIIFFKEFTLLSFDPAHARVIGLPVKFLEFLLSTITVLAIATGIQAVGVVLMAALLITPAAAARFWTDKLVLMVTLAAIFGGISGIAGSFVSYTAPSMPTGPWIVVVLSVIALFSIFMSPKKGMISRIISRRNHKQKVVEENILKAFYHLGEAEESFSKKYSVEQILEKRDFVHQKLMKGLQRLIKKGFILKTDNAYSFTIAGKAEGQRITRLHRLWELYLTKYLKIAPDHVHDDAEAIEHVITPEIEQRLEELLEFPQTDPHSKVIPGKS